jgi:KaiC/GvpD/RAD55 family RecA-like ATPase
MQNFLLRQAQEYVARGWSVIPIQYKSKIPAIASWKDYQTRLPTDEELRGWFSSGDHNIAVVTGSVSGLVVLDFDGPEGFNTLRSLKIRGAISSATGKGAHLFFKHPGVHVGNAVKKLPGLDIRGDGGYVLVYPSVHPSGRRYGWTNYSESTRLTDFPSQLFSNGPAVEEPKNTPGWISEALQGMQVGNIDNTLFKIASRMRHDGYTKTDAITLLQPHAVLAGASDGHLEDKVNHVWNSYEPKVEEPSSLALSDFMKDEASVEWLVPGLIAKKSIGFVAGLPETCKTWLTMDLAIELARGGSWVGLFPTTRSKVMFIDQERFAGETRRRFKALFKSKNIDYRDLEGQLVVQCGTTTRIDLDNSFDSLRRVLSDVRPDIIIVDSFVTFHNKEENNRGDIQVVLERIKAIRNEFGCTICFIDHENKGAFQPMQDVEEAPSVMRMAGSVAKPGAAEFAFTVRSKGKGTSCVYMTKATLGPAAEPFFVEVRDLDSSRSAIEVRGKLLS